MLGRPGTEQPGGVWRVSLPRTDLKVTLDGVEIRPSFALGSWLAFHPHGRELMVMGDLVLLEGEVAPVMRRLAAGGLEVTALTGDFVLTAGEVVPVQRALVENGIEVTAIHNHMLGEEPRLFFMHFWAVDDAEKLARGLRATLERTNSRRAEAAPGGRSGGG